MTARITYNQTDHGIAFQEMCMWKLSLQLIGMLSVALAKFSENGGRRSQDRVSQDRVNVEYVREVKQ